MSDLTTIARPYARALFSLAKEMDQTEQWSKNLIALSDVCAIPEIIALMSNPKISHRDLLDVIIGVAGIANDVQMKNFLRLLIENKRLSLIPEISRQFEELMAKEKGALRVDLILAHEMDESDTAKITEALRRHFDKNIELHTMQDKSLLGGVIIKAGDLVIDGSVRGKLESLAQAINF